MGLLGSEAQLFTALIVLLAILFVAEKVKVDVGRYSNLQRVQIIFLPHVF